MTVVLHDPKTIRLSGACPVDDAESLLQLLLANPAAEIDWRDCHSAHAAIIQVVLVARRRLQGPPASAFLNRFMGAVLSPSG